MSAHVYVDPANEEGALGRPFVFVEGIDFGLSPDAPPYQQGDFGWTQFHGCDPDHYPMMAHMPVLLDSIRQRGFTPVLVDFGDGTAHLEHNAHLLADILRHLRDHRTDPRPMAIAGASMGGQLARMALRELEMSDELHCHQLFVSLDSPHHGANVPLGLQHMLHFLGGDEGDIDALIGALSSQAARALLEVQLLPLPPREAHQALLDSIGLPTHCRNAAIANGGLEPLSGQQNPLLHYEHALLQSGWFGQAGDLIRLEVHPHPGQADHELAQPGQPVLAVVEHPESNGWPWPLQQFVGLGESSSSIGWDHLPGGTRPSIRQFAEAFNATAADTLSAWPLCIPPIGPDQYQSLHSFIPTTSALGLPPAPAPLDSAYLVQSPFDAVHHGLTNEPHSEINPANLDFVLAQLHAVECPLPPSSLLSDTNLTAADHWKWNGFGVIGEVALQSCAPEWGAASSPPDSHGTFRVHGCASPVDIHAGGALHIGAPSEGCNSSAELTMERGSVMTLSGSLVVHPGSTLEVLPGATLQFHGGHLDLRHGARLRVHPGAHLEFDANTLWSCAPDSEVALDGMAHIAADAQWSVHCVGPGSWSTASDFHLTGSPGASVALHDATGLRAWLASEGASITMEGLESLTAAPFDLRLTGHARVAFTTESGMHWRGHWKGLEADSISVTGRLWLDGTALSQVNLVHSEGPLLWENGVGFNGSAFSQSRSILREGEFSGFPIHLDLPEGSPNSLVEACRFANGLVGLTCTGHSPLRIEDSQFSLLTTGLKLHSNAAVLSCNLFDGNDTAVLADRSVLALAPSDGGGWNRFEHNEAHLRLAMSPLPSLLHGANHFGVWSSHWAEGTVDLSCTGIGLDWDITGQSWNWPVGWPQIQTGLQAVGADGSCLINAVDLSPVSLQECRAGGKGKKE